MERLLAMRAFRAKEGAEEVEVIDPDVVEESGQIGTGPEQPNSNPTEGEGEP